MKDWWIIIPVGLYLFVVVGALLIARKLRPTRWPFKDEEKLLRGPGESLRKKVADIDDSMLFELIGGTLVALVSIPGAVWLAKYLGASGGYALLAALASFTTGTFFSAHRIVGLWRERQAYHLGWFGERLVAEKLAPLRFSGWRVFHDVPFVSNGKPFNIDHVVVGEGGLFVIETKTRRMGGGRNGETDHEVCFDGQALHWPRYKNDESGLIQAERNAATLTAWIKQEIGQEVPATPILVIPAWSLKTAGKLGRRPCRVDSANWILNTFKDRRPCIPKQTVDLIIFRLLAKCRDVED
jgi:hypothetical protein